MDIQGKGFFIWQLPRTEGGNVQATVHAARKAGLTHVLIKIADNIQPYNVDRTTKQDLVGPFVNAFHAAGILVYGWAYVYGYDPIGEADIAIRRILDLEVDGFTVNAEAEYKQPGKSVAAREYMERLRRFLPNLPIALSSYRYPSLHPQLPWKEFLERCDINMPQVYWLYSHGNAGEQLLRSVREFEAITPFRPIVPTGAAFRQSTWSPTSYEVIEFLETARTLGLKAANFWEWANTRQYLPELWDVIGGYSWEEVKPPVDITDLYIQALNTHDPSEVVALYQTMAVHVTGARTIQGLAPIFNWYDTLFSETLPNATFQLTGFSGRGNSRHMTWTARSAAGQVRDGSDTFGLLDGKIAYHYSSFTVT